MAQPVRSVPSNGESDTLPGFRRGYQDLQSIKKEAHKLESVSERVADQFTAFSGSMTFVYIHAIWFLIWVTWNTGLLGLVPFDPYPFGLLTMIVSLEAIFLSTFVMISQNRADAKRQVLADHQWDFVQTEEKQNEQLLDLSKQILQLTDAIHKLTIAHTGSEPNS